MCTAPNDNLPQAGWKTTAEEGILLPLGHGLLVLGWLWFVGNFLSCGRSRLLIWRGFIFSRKVSVLGFSIQILLLLCIKLKLIKYPPKIVILLVTYV